MRFLGRIWLVQLVGERLQLSWEAVTKVVEAATPDIALLESSEVKSCHDTKIVAASTQGDPEVRVLFGVRIDYLTGRENHLKIENLYDDEYSFSPKRILADDGRTRSFFA